MHPRALIASLTLLVAGCGARVEAPPVVAIAPAPVDARAAPPDEPAPAPDLRGVALTDDGGRAFTPLEVAGRAVFVREGCHGCHEGAPVGEAPLSARVRGFASPAPSLATIGGNRPTPPAPWASSPRCAPKAST